MRRRTAALWAAFALGAWQLASVALLGTSPSAAAATALVGGLIILIVAAWGAVTNAAWAVWAVIALGALFAIAPFLASFRGASGYVASDLATGVLLILLGVVGVVDKPQVVQGRTLRVSGEPRRVVTQSGEQAPPQPEAPPAELTTPAGEDAVTSPEEPAARPSHEDEGTRAA